VALGQASSVAEAPRILLEGRPGVGKTTVAVRLAERLRDEGVTVRGILTREIREGERRVGFAVEALNTGAEGVLAHVDRPGPPRVGKYGVDVSELERVALAELERLSASDVAVIDELGKMELASERFRAAVERLFAGRNALVATVMRGRHPFTDALKRRPGTELIEVTRANRDELPARLASALGV
jgi:nucleoside-triphosphatase